MANEFFSKVNSDLIPEEWKIKLEEFSEISEKQVYLIREPLTKSGEKYEYEKGFVVLIPGFKLLIVNLNPYNEEYEDFCDDFLDDLGYLSDKFEYKSKLGRPRQWKKQQIAFIEDEPSDLDEFFESIYEYEHQNEKDKRVSELLISLLTGSINNISDINVEEPETLLDKVKQKIVLFDGDQTRFIFEEFNQKIIRIQGLAGTGKTELLLHKLKELYTNDEDSKIAFTCHNKVLSSSLKTRIPEFFTFMKVEEQIDWEERLFVFNSWGSSKVINSGFYAKICSEYSIPFHGFGFGDFEVVCKEAIKDLIAKGPIEPFFDYVLIDESQDFPEVFFDLCDMVTQNTIYIAGDIFQTIFVKQSNDVSPDFLLNKCYRTDPRTLMFSQAVGLGLYERPVINWLEKKELKSCGYEVSIDNNIYELTRPKIRRFDDPDEKEYTYKPVTIIKPEFGNLLQSIIDTISEIKNENPTLLPDDIGIVFLDSGREIYKQIDTLEYMVDEEFDWEINRGFDQKGQIENTLFVSNKNNVKGLEFPFVICVTSNRISQSISLRNALYMTMTRSFISSYLIMTDNNAELFTLWSEKLDNIIKDNKLVLEKPDESDILSEEELRIDEARYQSVEEMKNDIFKQNNITEIKARSFLTGVVSAFCDSKGNSVTKSELENLILDNYKHWD